MTGQPREQCARRGCAVSVAAELSQAREFGPGSSPRGSMEKYAEAGALSKDMERLEIEEKNGEGLR